MQRVYIRTDSNPDIGTGHVMRCLALASALRSKGSRVKFICKELKGSLRQTIQKNGFPLVDLPHTADSVKSEHKFYISQEQDSEETIAALKGDYPECCSMIRSTSIKCLIISNKLLMQ